MTVKRRGLLNEYTQAEIRLGARYCSYCSLMRDASTFTLKKGKPPMCKACISFRRNR